MRKKSNGQTAFEYMLLLGVVAAIVLIGFRKYVVRTRSASEVYFNKVSSGVMGPPPDCEDLMRGTTVTCP